MVEELHKVQYALGAGYLSAFPKEHFIRLQSLQAVWAPFYVVSSSPTFIAAMCVRLQSQHVSAQQSPKHKRRILDLACGQSSAAAWTSHVCCADP